MILSVRASTSDSWQVGDLIFQPNAVRKIYNLSRREKQSFYYDRDYIHDRLRPRKIAYNLDIAYVEVRPPQL